MKDFGPCPTTGPRVGNASHEQDAAAAFLAEDEEERSVDVERYGCIPTTPAAAHSDGGGGAGFCALLVHLDDRHVVYIDTSLLLYGSSRIWLSRVGMWPCLSEGSMQVMCILHAWTVWLFEVWNTPFDDIPKRLTHLSLKVIAFTSTSFVPGTRGFCSRLVIGGFVLDAT